MSAPDLASARLDDWLAALAAPIPEPGGGAAAGVVIATGAALVAMTAGYAVAPHRDAVLADATRARRDALVAAEHDGRMSAALVAAFRRPAGDAQRPAAIIATTVAAAEASAALVDVAASLGSALTWLEEHGEPRVAPDVAVAARMLACGIRATAVNIRCDTTSARDAGAEVETLAPLRTALAEALAVAQRFDTLADRVTATL
ncbi:MULTISPECIES: cyclodeaminase/cyclohydrolase family protein [Microbacterium]|uniref:Formiminotransferase-cyclodeaminase n=1 Tax=Microbacterium hominis TaxID=162426 RepID=A0A2K9D5V9_9MICO|nr:MULTISPECIES: cyclodeaminase/cyclohydrolase family protein [Microbacterium]AUG29045.1 formiminotransferase-cyclodeaminase [Microbacterium hominis]